MSLPKFLIYLHSTMFLLIQELESNLTLVNLFTFHNVSINSICLQKESEQYLDLHSTMFLLILKGFK